MGIETLPRRIEEGRVGEQDHEDYQEQDRSVKLRRVSKEASSTGNRQRRGNTGSWRGFC